VKQPVCFAAPFAAVECRPNDAAAGLPSEIFQ
jgi:hypothetical protein